MDVMMVVMLGVAALVFIIGAGLLIRQFLKNGPSFNRLIVPIAFMVAGVLISIIYFTLLAPVPLD
jgi:hypothetical protein